LKEDRVLSRGPEEWAAANPALVSDLETHLWAYVSLRKNTLINSCERTIPFIVTVQLFASGCRTCCQIKKLLLPLPWPFSVSCSESRGSGFLLPYWLKCSSQLPSVWPF
jgi:hypothetical protein